MHFSSLAAGLALVTHSVFAIPSETRLENSSLAREGLGFAQGRVVDASSHNALAGVSITVAGTRLRGVTNETGDFSIDKVPMGIVTLHLQHQGYKERDVGISVASEGGSSYTLAITKQRR